MSYLLVVPAIDLSIELNLPEPLERSIVLQWERLTDRSAREAFVRRIERQLETLLPEVIDWDIKEPTLAQVSYARAVAKEIGVTIPPDALRFRGLMQEFLEAHVPQAKAKWGQKVANFDKPPT